MTGQSGVGEEKKDFCSYKIDEHDYYGNFERNVRPESCFVGLNWLKFNLACGTCAF